MSFDPRHLLARSIWLKVHVAIATSAGLFFVILGLSGSLSVYRDELDVLLNANFSLEKPKGDVLPLDRIVEAVRQAHPKRYGPWTLELPREAGHPITAWYARPEETAERYYAPLMVSVNPYTGEVLANRFWGETAATWLVDLHTQLLAGRSGWNAVGMLGLLLMVSAASGLYLWWPGLAGLRQAVCLRRHAGLMLLLHDIHRGLGCMSAVWLMIVAFTGFNLAFPKLTEALVGDSAMAHGNEGLELRSTAVPNDHPVGLAQAVLIARGPFPRAEVRRITQPAGETGSYRVNLRQRGEINQRHPFTTVWVDRWSGQILDVRNPNRFTGGQSMLAWLWPAHTGEAFGTPGRLVWFLAGAIPLLLFITGMLRWLHRKGWVDDRPVNLGPVTQRLEVLMGAARCRLSPVLSELLVRLRDGLIGLLQALKRHLERLAARSQRGGD